MARCQVTELRLQPRFRQEQWTACRRVGLTQKDSTTKKDKIRQIDDFREFTVNSRTTQGDKIPVDGVDVIANIIKSWADDMR